MPETDEKLTRLDAIAPHVRAEVVRIDAGSGSAADLDRVRVLGVCVGSHVEVLRGGDPLIVRVFESRVGLSSSIARHVWVTPCEAAGCRGGVR